MQRQQPTHAAAARSHPSSRLYRNIDPAASCRLNTTTSDTAAAILAQNPNASAIPPSIAASGTTRAKTGAPGMIRSRYHRLAGGASSSHDESCAASGVASSSQDALSRPKKNMNTPRNTRSSTKAAAWARPPRTSALRRLPRRSAKREGGPLLLKPHLAQRGNAVRHRRMRREQIRHPSLPQSDGSSRADPRCRGARAALHRRGRSVA